MTHLQLPLLQFPLLRFFILFLPAALALTSGACTQKGVEGVWFPQSQIAQLQAGRHTQQEVATMLGAPNWVNPYRPHIHYYYGARTKQIGQLPPRLDERQMLILLYSPEGILQTFEVRNLDGVRFVRTDRDKTRWLRSARRSFFKDVFGNVGQVGTGTPP